ncbi:MAG TPA: DMT family transporter [Dongiaceae bacterium]|jgi:drug/metabolite transporter (DMT)-like permease|nr:DMT family transporter [Dongiaceae bacterium]
MTDGVLTLERQSGMGLSRDYRKGLVLTAGGTVLASFEGLLVRLVSVDSSTVIFWRGILLGLVMLAILIATRKKLHVRSLGFPAIAAILSFAGTILFFISAINATTVASTLVIASGAPLFAALLGWLFLREKPTRATSVAVVVVFAGLAIIFSGSLATSFIVGDMLALGYALSLAGYYVALQRCPESQIPSIIAFGGILSGILVWPFASAGIGSSNDLWILLTLGVVIVPAATMLLSSGPQYMPASHVTLIMMLEIVLGPLWVWMALSETPSLTTACGGALVLATIVAHSCLEGLRAAKPAI